MNSEIYLSTQKCTRPQGWKNKVTKPEQIELEEIEMWNYFKQDFTGGESLQAKLKNIVEGQSTCGPFVILRSSYTCDLLDLYELFSPHKRKKSWVHNPLLDFSVRRKVDQIVSVNAPAYCSTTYHLANTSCNISCQVWMDPYSYFVDKYFRKATRSHRFHMFVSVVQYFIDFSFFLVDCSIHTMCCYGRCIFTWLLLLFLLSSSTMYEAKWPWVELMTGKQQKLCDAISYQVLIELNVRTIYLFFEKCRLFLPIIIQLFEYRIFLVF